MSPESNAPPAMTDEVFKNVRLFTK